MKLRPTVVAVIAACLMTVAAAQENPLQEGMAYFQKGDYASALRIFEAADRAQPGNAMLVNLIGITQTKLGQITDANLSYRKAIHLNPALEAPHKNLGFNLLNQSEYPRAIEELQTAISKDGSDEFAHYYLAIAYLKSGREKESIAQLGSSEQLVENDTDTASEMAMACLHTGDKDDAVRVIRAVEQRSGFTLEQEFALAVALSSSGLHQDALPLFEHMAALQPDSWVRKFNLAIAWFDAGDTEKAQPILQALATERPDDERILNLLGTVYEAKGDLHSALDTYQKAVAADPKNTDAYLDYTRLLMDVDRYDDAASLIEKGLQNAQDTYALQVRLGAIQIMKGNLEQARQSFQQAIRENPNQVVGYVGLAKTYMKLGDDAAAENLLAGARNKLPRDFALEYVYGLICAQMNETDKALEALKNAEQMAPNVVEPHYQLGKAYMETGQLTEARNELERVIALDPNHVQALAQLCKVYAKQGDAQKAQQLQTQVSGLINRQRDSAIAAERERIRAAYTP
jgi:tetratricopeptide (TPR) repeat protein